VRQAVEPVALDALRSERPGQRQALCDRRHLAVEGGVEARDLRELGEAGAHGLDAVERGRGVGGGEWDEGPQPRKELRRDTSVRRVVAPAVNDAVAGGVRGGNARRADDASQRRAGVGEGTRLVAEHPVGRVADRETALGEADPFDRARHGYDVVLIDRQLERGRSAVHAEDTNGHVHFLPSRFPPTPTTPSASKPNFFWSCFKGGEAPNVFMPITCPRGPTYRSQPSVEPCSTATRAVTSDGRTLSRYSGGCSSKSSHDGIDTTRDRMPSTRSCSWLSTARLSSLPDAIRISSGFPPAASAST